MVFIFCSALWLYDVQMNVMNANRVENDVAHLGKIDKFLWREREREENWKKKYLHLGDLNYDYVVINEQSLHWPKSGWIHTQRLYKMFILVLSEET